MILTLSNEKPYAKTNFNLFTNFMKREHFKIFLTEKSSFSKSSGILINVSCLLLYLGSFRLLGIYI